MTLRREFEACPDCGCQYGAHVSGDDDECMECADLGETQDGREWAGSCRLTRIPANRRAVAA